MRIAWCITTIPDTLSEYVLLLLLSHLNIGYVKGP
jgi:hypothetical protein